MRKIILYTASSLDNYLAGPNHEIDWLFTEGDYGYQDFYSSIDTTLAGNKTYQIAKNFPDVPYFPDKKNYVFTRNSTLTKDENCEFVSGDLVKFTQDLKKQTGKDIWLLGGGEINQIFLENQLIDKMVIAIHPIILGDGLPLFPKIPLRTNLQLTDSQVFENGLVILSYQVRRN